MGELSNYIRDLAEGGLLAWPLQIAASERFGVSVADVERVALEQGILPARYQRNRNTVSVSQQLILHRSTVAVIGCGGLGGNVIEALARLGIGSLLVIDQDVFEEHNLNRQILSSPATLGRPKVEEAVRHVGRINPAVNVIPYHLAFSSSNGPGLLASCDLAIDALDDISTRLALAESCAEVGIPLIHGAIAGWYGQVTTILPGDDPLNTVFNVHGGGKGLELQLGNPSFTPVVVAGLQVAEACKLLLNVGAPLHGRALLVDLLGMDFDAIAWGER